MSTYEKLSNATVEVGPLLKSHVTHILKKIKGKLTATPKIRTGFTFTLDVIIHRLLVIHIFKVIRDYRRDDGTTLPVNVEIVKDKRTTLPKLYTIHFFSLHAFHFHFTHLSEHAFNVTKFTEKKVKTNKVTLAISPDKPLIITFKPSTETMKITGHYAVTNQYGELCSF